LKLSRLALVLPAAVTAIGPSVAPTGTVAVIWRSLSAVKLAEVPSKVTAVAPVNPVPVMVTEVPTGPLKGRNATTMGAANAASAPGIVTTIRESNSTRAIRAERRLAVLAT
jgi:hypothetical protein